VKVLVSLLVAFALNLASITAKADSCQYTFRCQGSICERVTDTTCPPAPSNAAIYVTPSSTTLIGPSTDAPSNQIVAPTNGISKNLEAPLKPSNGFGCAENGSCYGDISNITNLPKTVPVLGYYRKDGTYVRGYYRSHR